MGNLNLAIQLSKSPILRKKLLVLTLLHSFLKMDGNPQLFHYVQEKINMQIVEVQSKKIIILTGIFEGTLNL